MFILKETVNFEGFSFENLNLGYTFLSDTDIYFGNEHIAVRKRTHFQSHYTKDTFIIFLWKTASSSENFTNNLG